MLSKDLNYLFEFFGSDKGENLLINIKPIKKNISKF